MSHRLGVFRVGPPAWDLGRLAAYLPDGLSDEHVRTYRAAHASAGGAGVTHEDIVLWIRDGLMLEALEWIAIYFERRGDPAHGWRDWDAYRRDYVTPRVRRIRTAARAFGHGAR